MNSFSALGEVYDLFNDAAGYDAYLELICEEFRCLSTHEKDYQPRAVDLGCGTGEMSLRLALRGFDVIGIDRSYEMLAEAMQKRDDNPELSLFFVRQDMRNFQMDAKANLFLSCYDCLNYLNSVDELRDTLSCVSEHMVSGGVFIFDLNTLYRFKEYYGNRVFCFKKRDRVLVWENRFDEAKGVCHFDIELFQREGGLYRRSTEKHRQTYFSHQTVLELLQKTDFTPVRTVSANELWGFKGDNIKNIYIVRKN